MRNDILFSGNNDSFYKEIANEFPLKFYEKFKKINVYLFVFLLIISVTYLIVGSYVKLDIYWYCSIIPCSLFILEPIVLSKINCNLTIKKFKDNLIKKLPEHKHKIINTKIDYKKLYAKRTSFVLELINQYYLSLK